MRSISKLSVLCLAAGVMTACALPDEVVTTENIPTAGVRFINAVPDTMAVDFRFTDIVESNAHFRIGFRASPVTAGGVPASTAVQYKNARAGTRKFSVFLDDTLQSVASTKLLSDSTFQFDAGKLYTVMMWGNARSTAAADKMRFSIWEEAVADPAANVSLRLINATSAAIDGYQYLSTGAIGTADWGGLAAYTAGAYVNVAPTTGSATRKFQIRNAGGANPIVACPDPSALKGVAATADIEALPGTDIAGTAITGIVFPGSVAGSKAVQFSTTTGSTNQLATAAGYESARSYISDGFCAGMTVNATGASWAAGNSGTSVIASVVDGLSSSSAAITATATGYGRTSGTFPAFAAGDNITAAGFTTSANNGTSVIVSGGGTNALVVTKTGGTVLEAGSTGSQSLGVTAGALGTTGGTYTRTVGSFIADGFVVGHAITATGFAAASGATPSNNGASTIAAISADGLSMTVSKATGMANEAAAAGRTLATTTTRSITGFGKMNIVGGRTAQAAGNSRTLTVTPLPPAITFVWDRRPPRTACSPLC